MTHEEAYPLLPDLVGLRLVDTTEGALRRHVAGCAECAARVAALERVAGVLETAADARSHDLSALEKRVLTIPATHPRRPPNRFMRRLVPAGIALAAAASIAALVLSLTGPDSPASPGPFEAQQTVALRPLRGEVAGTVELGKPSGPMRVVRINIHGLRTDGARSYDLWLVSDAGAMKAGSFGPGKDGQCTVELTMPSAERWDTITVTPTGAGPRRQVLASS